MEEKLLVDNKQSKKIPLVPSIFLGIVIIFTIGIYIFNSFVLEKKYNSLNTEVEDLKKSIATLMENKSIQLYELVDNHKNEIAKYERNSDIVKYMEHLENTSRKYGVNFSGFSISDGEIKSEITVRKVNFKGEPEAYERVSDFIKKYREDPDSLLDLKFINSFDGMDEIKFLVNFKTKNLVEKKESNNKNNLNDKNNKDE